MICQDCGRETEELLDGLCWKCAVIKEATQVYRRALRDGLSEDTAAAMADGEIVYAYLSRKLGREPSEEEFLAEMARL